MLALVLADRHLVGVVEQDVGGLQDRVVEQPDRRPFARRDRPDFSLNWVIRPASPNAGDAAEDPPELRVLGDVALHEQDAAFGVDAAGEVLRGCDPGAVPQAGPDRDRR